MRLAATIVLTLATAATAQLTNPGFESGTGGWFGTGPGVLSPNNTVVFDGTRSARLAGRTDVWNGIAQSLLGDLTPGHVYRVSARVRSRGPGPHRFQLTVFQNDANGDAYTQVAAEEIAPGDDWRLLAGAFRYEPSGPVNEILLYVEGPEPGVDLFADQFVFEDLGAAADWQADADARIQQLRTREVTVRVEDTQGNPITGADVDVCMTERHYPFGSAISSFALGNAQYEQFFRDNFNWAVPENALKWRQMEPIQGAPDYTRGDSIVSFCQSNGITLRGHTLFWCVDQFVQQWVMDLSNPALTAAISTRLADIVSRYDGVMKHWDVNNEMLHGRFFADRLGDGVRASMFQQAEALSPDTLWFVNDYNVVASAETGSYVQQVEGLVSDGAPVDGVGVQCHFSGEIEPLIVRARLDHLAALGLPIWVTELDVGSTDPAVRADYLEQAYRSLFSHPSVDGILLWGFWAGAHWRAGESELLDLDFTVNPAGQRFLDLMDEWSTSFVGVSDVGGETMGRAFHGLHDITVVFDGETVTQQVDVAVGTDPVTVTIVLDTGCASDFNNDGVGDVLDLLDYLALWFIDDPAAEFDGLTGSPVLDLLAFLVVWFEGC